MAKDFTSQAGVFMQAEAEKKAGKKIKVQTTKASTSARTIKVQVEDKEKDIPIGYELKPESKSKRLNLLIRPTVYEALKDKAKAEGVSANEYINNLILKDIEG